MLSAAQQKEEKLEDNAYMQSAYCQYVAGSGNGVTVPGVGIERTLIAQCHGCDDCIILLFQAEGSQFAFDVVFSLFCGVFCLCKPRQLLLGFQLCGVR